MKLFLFMPLLIFSVYSLAQNTPPPPKKVLDEYIYTFPEKEAEFPGGYSEFQKYISENFQYPVQATGLEVQGIIYIDIVVNEDGTITEIKIVKGISSEFDKEAIRIVKNMPNWIAGEIAGKKVKSKVLIPIRICFL